MLIKPKLCFSVGYFPVDDSISQMMFHLHYQDPRSILLVEHVDSAPRRYHLEIQAPNQMIIASRSTLSINDLGSGAMYLAGSEHRRGDYHLKMRAFVTEECPQLISRLVEALSFWGQRLPAFSGDPRPVIDPEEPTAPFMIEPYELQKFVIP